MAKGKSATARAVALVGPAGAGKTSLMEALLHAAGAIDRLGSVNGGNCIGDTSPEARARTQTLELNIASFTFDEDRYTLLDLPGSVEFAAEGDAVLAAVDLAIVVTDPDPDRALLLQPILKELDRLSVPRIVFVNKIDQARVRLRDYLEALQAVSTIPLVARQIPIWENEQVSGYVDLANERAYVYRPGKPSERIDMPAHVTERENEARFHMLEQLADYDDALMEKLLADEQPQIDEVFADLVKETQAGLIAPVFLGAALNSAGVRRLLKALRHDTPGPQAAADRVGAQGVCAYVLKSSHTGQSGKLVFARAFGGAIADGADLTRVDATSNRVSGVFHLLGAQQKKVADLKEGEIGALGRLDAARACDLLSAGGAKLHTHDAALAPPRFPVYSLAIATEDRKDDVRVSAAIAKLMEEDCALQYGHDPQTHELVLRGQGEIHLRVTLDRLKRRYQVGVQAHRPRSAYKETIRKSVTQRGRHKKQSGGHGQFGDVVCEIKPLPRSSGFQFEDRVTGGVVPRQWIPAVEMGVKDAMEKGPLGFPVVDVHVALTDGSHHSVDSSEIAFRTAGRIAMSDGLGACEPFLLEPIEKITIFAPNTATSRITSMLSTRRGQILGFDAREDWPGWDRIEGFIPQSERQDLIVELRSATQGLGSYIAEFAHMAELTGRLAEDIVAKAKNAA
jgi:elongation factor G